MEGRRALGWLLLLQLLDGSAAQRRGQQTRLDGSAAQRWGQQIRWENRGRLYSLLNSASRLLPRGSSGQSLYLSADRARARAPTGSGSLWTLRRVALPGAWRGEEGSGAGQGLGEAPPDGTNATEAPSRAPTPAREGGGSPAWTAQGGNEIQGSPVPPRRWGSTEGGDDPRRNSVFYNLHPPPGSGSGSSRRPPTNPWRSGHGTRYFHQGLPDLIPDPYFIQASTYVQRVQMYALRCAAEENCLARSAYRPDVSDISYRVLLRFPQRVKNQGTADFLPVKPQHAWEWHSCHQHYHSMDAFSNYDLLDAFTHRKVAEGHKASFCLEDTTCDAGFRRRYACTAHTQGLGPGCYDTYNANIDCQWIDITDVPPGNYILKVMVNPDFLVAESDFTNNVARCDITYNGRHATARNCRITRG